MNKFAPQHSRLFKEMILVAKPDKPFQYTAKSTARRQAIIKQYEDEIEAVYNAVEATTQANIPLPEEWNIISTTSFVRAVVNGVLVRYVQDDDDIFQHGCDRYDALLSLIFSLRRLCSSSLQATWIRNALTRALRDGLQLDTRRNVDNFVYEYPSISSLATFLVAHVSGERTDKSSDAEKEKDMARMVEKYSADFPTHLSAGGTSSPARKCVLLTGSTGGLGAFVLSVLVADAEVKYVYCLNRPSVAGSVSLLDRQRASLVDKGLPIEILESEKVILLQAQLEQQQFGLEKSVYDAVCPESSFSLMYNY
jgi:hypothetical protein